MNNPYDINMNNPFDNIPSVDEKPMDKVQSKFTLQEFHAAYKENRRGVCPLDFIPSISMTEDLFAYWYSLSQAILIDGGYLDYNRACVMICGISPLFDTVSTGESIPLYTFKFLTSEAIVSVKENKTLAEEPRREIELGTDAWDALKKTMR